MSANLFEPFQLADPALPNRMVMAPMTRNRADENGVAPPMMVTHYQERAGLTVPEFVPASPEAVDYPFYRGAETRAA